MRQREDSGQKRDDAELAAEDDESNSTEDMFEARQMKKVN